LKAFYEPFGINVPTRIQEMLLIINGVNLDKLAECADKLYEHPSSVDIHTAQAMSTNYQDTIQQLTKQITTLSTRVDKLAKRP